MSQKSRNKAIIIFNKIDGTSVNIMLSISPKKDITNKFVLKNVKNFLIKSFMDYQLESIIISPSMIYDSYLENDLSIDYLNNLFKKLTKIYNNNFFSFNKNIPVNLLKYILDNDDTDVFCLRLVPAMENINDCTDISPIKVEKTSTGLYLFYESYDKMISDAFYLKMFDKNFILNSYQNYTLKVE